ncbi:MAG: hypothetical protein HC853_01690 [Anaerolineae bacterium]|nr:hypothetical protein [Anaerolineae bacterium]
MMKGYSEAQFIEFLRTGKTSAGKAIPNEVMPWKLMGAHATEIELKALFTYLQSLPARETGK